MQTKAKKEKLNTKYILKIADIVRIRDIVNK